jgi:transposase-like protein
MSCRFVHFGGRPVFVTQGSSGVRRAHCASVRSFYVVMGVTVNGERDILGIWLVDGAEGARF